MVLDLDETLICAYEASSLPAIIRTQAVEAGVKCFELECLSSEKVSPYIYIEPDTLIFSSILATY